MFYWLHVVYLVFRPTRGIHNSILINTVNGSMRLHLVLYTASFRWQIKTPRKSLAINSNRSISASDSKNAEIYYPVKSNFIRVILTKYWQVRKKWRHMLRVDKACLQKKLHKHDRKHNGCVAGFLNLNNNSFFSHNYLIRYSAWLASMSWCLWSASVLVGLATVGHTKGVHYL